MTKTVQISCKGEITGDPIKLPASKSISNRALVLNALSGNRSTVSNLSEARDTVLMQQLLSQPEREADVRDAGTTMRFLTAFFAATNQSKILTGTDRMKQRPIELLVEALRAIGANIEYKENEGFPPIEIIGFNQQKVKSISIAGDVSSQYISALMMVGPTLPQGLTLELKGKIGSMPYIRMTSSIMSEFGVHCNWEGNRIELPPQKYKPTQVTVESDWSAASYWFAIVAMAENAEVVLSNMTIPSIQGDSVIIEIMEKLGVKTTLKNEMAILTKQSHLPSIEWDFSDCPDLAQTVLPVCAVKNIGGTFTGLESLRIKESDRIAALQQELAKVGATIQESEGHWILMPNFNPAPGAIFSTYHDHRMAMGLAPIATVLDIAIEDPDVVNKSYPGFWDDLSEQGFTLNNS